MQGLRDFLLRESADLLILDGAVPNDDALALLDWLRQQRQDQTPVIMVSVTSEERETITALGRGADKCVPSNDRASLVSGAGRGDAASCQPLQGGMSAPDIAPYRVDFANQSIHLDGEVIPLTRKEFDLVNFLFRNIGRQISRNHMLETVWGRNSGVLTRTVDTHISRIRQRLRLYPENGFRIAPMYNFGYRFERTT